MYFANKVGKSKVAAPTTADKNISQLMVLMHHDYLLSSNFVNEIITSLTYTAHLQWLRSSTDPPEEFREDKKMQTSVTALQLNYGHAKMGCHFVCRKNEMKSGNSPN